MSDRKTIGLTPAGRRVIDRIGESFKERQQAAQFAMAVAISHGGDVPAADDVDTAWNVGSFDSTGEIRAVISSLYPQCTEPYRFVERLVDRGLAIIADRLENGEMLADIMRDGVIRAAQTNATDPEGATISG